LGYIIRFLAHYLMEEASITMANNTIERSPLTNELIVEKRVSFVANASGTCDWVFIRFCAAKD